MARKKQEVQLQLEVESQESWEELLQKEGLIVVDVYQDWCGPCRAMTSFFRRIKNETGDDLLSFAVAKADTIDSLERYRGKCEPCFLFYGGGALLAVVRGANPPVIDRTIRQRLDEEHKILRGEKERVEIRDPAFAGMEEEEKGAADEKEAEKEEEVDREVTFALIKPDAVAAGKVEEIMEKLEAAGIEVLYKEERQLTDEEARSFYAHHSEEEFFEALIDFMCSGESVLLALAKGDEGIINEFRELIGPTMVEEAKENAPESLRAAFGSESYKNAVHGADSRENAAKELAFFFPDFAVPKTHRKVVVDKAEEQEEKATIQRTLALIRPDAYNEYKDSILAKIKEAGFTIAMQKEVQLTQEQTEQFYKEHREEEYFEELTARMTSGPLIALALARQDAISGWRQMLGPTDVKAAKESAPESLRAQFSKEDVPINLLHGSDSEQHAQEELDFFFPMEQTLIAIKPDAYESRDEIIEKVKEAGFHVAARKETHLTAEMAREFYKDVEEKEYFNDLVNHMTSGSTLFMVLSREDAVQGWRSLMGATDPEKATEDAPESLRALYGKDVKENALHGSSNLQHAGKSIQLIFGDVNFDAQGKLSGGKDAAEAMVSEDAGETEAEDGGDTHRSEAEAAPEGDKESSEAAAAAEGSPAEEATGGEAQEGGAEEEKAAEGAEAEGGGAEAAGGDAAEGAGEAAAAEEGAGEAAEAEAEAEDEGGEVAATEAAPAEAADSAEAEQKEEEGKEATTEEAVAEESQDAKEEKAEGEGEEAKTEEEAKPTENSDDTPAAAADEGATTEATPEAAQADTTETAPEAAAGAAAEAEAEAAPSSDAKEDVKDEEVKKTEEA